MQESSEAILQVRNLHVCIADEGKNDMRSTMSALTFVRKKLPVWSVSLAQVSQ